MFRIAWQRFADVEPTLPWLYGIARNVVGTEYRRTTRLAALVQRSEGESLIAAQLPDDPRSLEVRLALAQLRPADRELLFMTYWEDLTPAEVAEILGIAVASVWMRLTRARAALGKKLDRSAGPDATGGER